MTGTWVLGLGLAVGLTLPGILPEVANISFFVGSAITLIALPFVRGRDAARLSAAALLPLVSGVMLVLAFILATRDLRAVIYAGYFMPLYLIAALATAARIANERMSPASIAAFAALGCVAGLGVACYDAFVLGLPAPGTSVNNPIHFADILLTLAFVSLVGLYDSRTAIRVIAIAGCLAGVTAMWLSGARGPVLALPPMLWIATFVMVWQVTPTGLRWALSMGALALTAAAMVVVWNARLLDQISAFSDAMMFLRSGDIVDHSTWERITMYQGAWNAWLQSPIFGHGLADVVWAARSTFAPDAEFPTYDHLHSDIANFAVAGGAAGLLAYLGFLLTPLVAIVRSGRSPREHAAQLLAATIPTGYVVMGLTNTMFGILSQTVLYAVVAVLVLHLARPTGTNP